MLKKDLDLSDPRYFSPEGAELNLSGCEILRVELEQFLVPFLKTHPEIKILDLSNMKIRTVSGSCFSIMSTDMQVRTVLGSCSSVLGLSIQVFKALVAALPPKLTEFYLDGTTLMDEEIVALAEKLPQTIAVLDLGIIDIGAGGIQALAKALSPKLTKLTLHRRTASGNSTSFENIKALANVLNKALDLADLTLTGFNINAEGAKAIGEALANKSKLAKLDLSNNQLRAEGAEEIGKAIADKKNLAVLNLGSNGMGSVCAESIAPALVDKPNLAVLNLSWNWLGVDAAQSIANALVGKPRLASLNLDGNYLSNKGVKIICRSLVDKSNLQHLNLAKNDISHVGVKEICKVLAHQPDPTSLDLQVNNMSDEGIETICNTHKNKPNFSELDVSRNKIGNAGAVAISKVIGNKKNFSKLVLNDNKIGDRGAKAICKAILYNEKFKEFDCSGNRISYRDAEMLAAVLAAHPSFSWKQNGGIACLQRRFVNLVPDQSARYAQLARRCDSMFEESDPVTRANFARKKRVEKKEIPDSTEQSSGVSATQSGSSVAKVIERKTFPTPMPSLRSMTMFAIQRVLKKEQHASLSLTEKTLRAQLLPAQADLQGLSFLQQSRIKEAKLRAVLPGDDLVKAFLPKM